MQTLSHFFLKTLFSLILFTCSSFIQAQSPAYQIDITINNFEGDTCILAFRRADKVYPTDTATVTNGKMIFEGKKILSTGIYLVLMPPDNKFFEIIVTPKEQHFSVETAAPDFFKNLKFTDAPDNQLLYDYQLYMNEKGTQVQNIQTQMGIETDAKKREQLKNQSEKLFEMVTERQNYLIKNNKGMFAAKLIAAVREPQVPDPPVLTDGTIDSTFRFRYYRQHFFDDIDFSEPGLVRTPYLKQKIDYFTDKLTVQSPDSLIAAIDMIIGKSQANQDVFQYCLPYLLNKYYRPKVVGLDEVYVHLANKYYRTGLADWVDEDALKKILDDAYMIGQVLIGNIAPEVECQLFDYEKEEFTDELVSLHGIEAEYTVVFLWKPGCPACRKMTEELKIFYEAWKDKGVEVYAISSASHMDLEKAKKDIKLKEVTWITVADPYLKARALQKFYGTSLPKLYLLDKDKKIIVSRIGPEQLPKVIENYEKERS